MFTLKKGNLKMFGWSEKWGLWHLYCNLIMVSVLPLPPPDGAISHTSFTLLSGYCDSSLIKC